MTGEIATFEQLKALPASVAILDRSGMIVAVNDAWKSFGQRNGLRVPQSAIGTNYLHFCAPEDPRTRRLVQQLKALLAGRLDLLTLIYPCHSPARKRWFSLIGLPLALDKPAGVALLHVNLTGMLPHQARARRALAQTKTDLDAISGAVERTVSDALAGQLDIMFAGAREAPAREQAPPPDDEKMKRALASLSQRQLEVLRLLGQGRSNKEMARALLLSPNTVKLHVSAILKRLNLRSRTHAALLSSRLDEPADDGP